MTAASPARPTLLDTIETQRLGCELAGSPLYDAILRGVAADVVGGGPCADLLEPWADAPFGDAIMLRFLAGLHRLALEGRAPDLAALLPSTGGTPDGSVASVAVAAAGRHLDELRRAFDDGVQTNEVGRSVALLGGYLEVARSGLPVRLLEVGASAGLNLNVDRYRFRGGGRAFGPPDSALAFEEPWSHRQPDLAAPLVIAERRGSDPSPIDPCSPVGRVRLRSFVWPDQLDRLARLDAALEVAAAHPPVVDRADAVSWLRGQLAGPVPGCTTVVVHSIVLQYLSRPDRTAFLEILDRAGSRATRRAPLAWLRLEPGGDQAELRLTTWPGGESQLLATSAYHGPPVVWLGHGSADERVRS